MKEENEEKKKETADEIVARTAAEERDVTDMIKKANEAAERLEKANKQQEENLDRRERIYAQEKLGGRADAGGREQTQDEKDTEGARKLLEGTGFEDRLFPEKK